MRICFANNALKRLLLIVFIAAACLPAFSQVDQRVALANKYFNAGEYYTAANLYEQFLNPAKKEVPKANFPLNPRRFSNSGAGKLNKLDILYKQAESYRLANYWTDAADRYKKCFEKDSLKYSDALYWYAVCQRSLGKYDVAEESLNRFLKNQNFGKITSQDAEMEAQTVQFAKKQIARPDTVLFSVKKINTAVGESKGIFGLTGSGDQFIFTSTVTDSMTVNGVNPNHSRLFSATIANNSLQNSEPITIDGVDFLINQGAASISPDKKFLYFTQWERVNGRNISSIYLSVKNKNDWGKPVLLSSVNKAGYSSKQPYCSADGKTLFFASNMPGGVGNFDIWSAPLRADGTAGKAANAGATINTEGDEEAPFYQVASNDLVFSSNGRQGMGGFDLYAAKMNGSQWSVPENMGYPINSSRDDIYFFAPGGNDLLKDAIISSDRGAGCCLETYSISKSPKKKMITGVIRDCNTNEPLADAKVIMKNISGKNLQATTGPDGKFSFSLEEEANGNSFYVSKNKYKEKSEGVAIENINSSDWKVDVLQNRSICLDAIKVKKLEIKAENVVTIYFDFDKSILKERGIAQLDSIYTVLSKNSNATIQISGYTDGLGTNEYNKKLSDKRAKACADYLIEKGIDTNRISFESFGACCPVEMEKINGRDNPDGRSKNRRALINVSKE
jgi:outer membrane protein OmpA-like peptidoglycan-associated protein